MPTLGGPAEKQAFLKGSLGPRVWYRVLLVAMIVGLAHTPSLKLHLGLLFPQSLSSLVFTPQ